MNEHATDCIMSPDAVDVQVRGCTGWRQQGHTKMTPGTLEFVNEDDTTLLRLELQKEKGLHYCDINGSAEEHKGGVCRGQSMA